MCRPHYDTWIADTSDLPRCAGSGCDRPATLAHLCRNHYNNRMRRVRLGASPASLALRVGRPCRTVDCLEPAHDAGFCWEHYRQWLDETAGKARWVSQGCDRPAEVHGMCTKHDQYKRYHERRRRAAV